MSDFAIRDVLARELELLAKEMRSDADIAPFVMMCALDAVASVVERRARTLRAQNHTIAESEARQKLREAEANGDSIHIDRRD